MKLGEEMCHNRLPLSEYFDSGHSAQGSGEGNDVNTWFPLLPQLLSQVWPTYDEFPDSEKRCFNHPYNHLEGAW